jgi:NADPH:quinone reductase-like Zn-dependent oxidoreductase
MRRKRHSLNTLVRVTHASVGVTEATAVRGDYLLQPTRGFVPGCDFVGIIERLSADDRSGLHAGQRVAGILPRMGAPANLIRVAPSLLVPVPDLLDSATTATVPLDAATALFAIDALAISSGTLLVQGAGSAVGAWAAQLATARGLIPIARQRASSPRCYAAMRGQVSAFVPCRPSWPRDAPGIGRRWSSCSRRSTTVH